MITPLRLMQTCPVCDASPGHRCRALNQRAHTKLKAQPHRERLALGPESNTVAIAKARAAYPETFSRRCLPERPHGTQNRYAGGCRCPQCRTAHAEAARRARAAGLLPGDPRHGTLGGYTTHGCRCARCRDASTAYRQALRLRTRAAVTA